MDDNRLYNLRFCEDCRNRVIFTFLMIDTFILFILVMFTKEFIIINQELVIYLTFLTLLLITVHLSSSFLSDIFNISRSNDKDVDQIEVAEMISTLNDHAMQAEKNLKEEQEEIKELKELDDLDEDPNMVKLSLQQVGTSAFRAKCDSLGFPVFVYTKLLMGYQRIGMYLEMNQEYINPNDIYYLLFLNLDDTLTRLTKLTRYTHLGIINTLLLVSDIAKEYENIPTPCVLGDPDNLQKSELTLDKLSEIVN